MTMTCDDVDMLRDRLDCEPEPTSWSAPMYAPDPDDDDIDTEDDTQEIDVPVVVSQPRCSCPVLEPYPDGWLSLPQWEFLSGMEWLFDEHEVRCDGASVWVPLTEEDTGLWLTFGGVPHTTCTLFQTVFDGRVETRIDLNNPSLTGA